MVFSDAYVCKYDGTLKNLTNFDLCMFFDIPYTPKTICLYGFENTLDANNSDSPNSLTSSNTNDLPLDYKDKIKSLITNNLINNYIIRTKYTNVIVNCYSSNPENKFNSQYIKPNKYFLSGSKYQFNQLESLDIMEDYLNNMKKIDQMNKNSYANLENFKGEKKILSILILDSIDLKDEKEISIIKELFANYYKYKIWIICDFVKIIDENKLRILESIENKLLCRIYSSHSPKNQIMKYYINDFVERISDIKYLYNTFEEFKKKNIHLVSVRQFDLLNLSNLGETNNNLNSKNKCSLMALVPYKIKKPITNALCASDKTNSSSYDEEINGYKEHKINVFNENWMINKIDYHSSLSETKTELELSTKTDFMVEYLANSEKIKSNSAENEAKTKINTISQMDDVAECTTNSDKMKTESSKTKSSKTKSSKTKSLKTKLLNMKKNIARDYLIENSLLDTSLKTDDSMSTTDTTINDTTKYSSSKSLNTSLFKSSNKDIFIKKNKSKSKSSQEPKNIQFKIGSNIKIQINF
jgi:hypothetical protein